jgi:hypothetical protein
MNDAFLSINQKLTRKQKKMDMQDPTTYLVMTASKEKIIVLYITHVRLMI